MGKMKGIAITLEDIVYSSEATTYKQLLFVLSIKYPSIYDFAKDNEEVSRFYLRMRNNIARQGEAMRNNIARQEKQ